MQPSAHSRPSVPWTATCVPTWLLLATVFLMCSLVSACGSSGDEGPALEQAAVEPAAPVVFKDATFAGKTVNPDLFGAVVTHAGGIEAYFCDGKRDFWFRGLAQDSVIEMQEAGGAILSLEVADEVVVGHLKVGDTLTAFEIPKASRDALHRAETYVGEQRVLAGWIRLPSGEQRGTIRAGGTPLPSTLSTSTSLPVVNCTGCEAFVGALTPAVFDSNAATGLRNKAGHEFTVIGLGDSFMSGEGAPLTPGLFSPVGAISGQGFQETWSNGLPTSRGQRDFNLTSDERTLLAREARACHRGAAGLTLAVEALRTTWPANVDIIHQTFACSGAKVAELLDTRYSGPANCPQFGSLDPNYAFCLAISDDMPTRSIRPQATEALDFLSSKNLKADAVVMSIGGNDMGFGAVIADCLAPFSDCGKPGTAAQRALADGKAVLPGRYKALNDRLVSAGIPRQNIFLTSHPNPLRKTSNSLCAGADFLPDLLLTNMSTANAEFGTLVHAEVNQQVADAVRTHGWRGITSMLNTEIGHGLCTAEPWYNTRNAALSTQGEDLPSDNGLLNFASVFSTFFKVELSAGMIHPNARGHREGYMPAYRDALDAALTTRFTPKVPARFRAGQVFSDGSINLVWDDNNDFESKTVIRNTANNQTFEAAADRTGRVVPLNGVQATFRAKACFTGPGGRDICSAEGPAITVQATKPTHTPQVTANEAPVGVATISTLAWNDLAPTRTWTTLELTDPAGAVTKRAVVEQSIALPGVAAGTQFRVAACNDLGCGPATPKTAVATSSALVLAPCPTGQRRQSDGVCRSISNTTLR